MRQVSQYPWVQHLRASKPQRREALVAQWLRIHLQCRRPQFNSWVRKIPGRRDWLPTPVLIGFLGGSDSKESACNVGDLGSIPGLGRSLGGGHGNPLQYSCLENPMDRGAWQATVHGVAKRYFTMGIPGDAGGKESTCQCRRR